MLYKNGKNQFQPVDNVCHIFMFQVSVAVSSIAAPITSGMSDFSNIPLPEDIIPIATSSVSSTTAEQTSKFCYKSGITAYLHFNISYNYET